MRRLLYPTEEAAALADFAGIDASGQRSEKKQRRVIRIDFDVAKDEAKSMLTAQNFAEARATHLVMIYELMHERVYGVAATDMTTSARKKAVFRASAMLKTEFAGDVGAAVEFLRWFWRREKWVEAKRRASNEASTYRVTWWAQFAPKAVVDYRLAKARGLA